MTDRTLHDAAGSPIAVTPLQRLTRFAQDMGTLTSRTAIAERILMELCEITTSRQGTLYLLDREHDRYDRVSTIGGQDTAAGLPPYASTHALVRSLANDHRLLSVTAIPNLPQIGRAHV